MILGIGTDLTDIRRIEKACAKESFLKRVFTEAERREAEEHISRLAGDFAVKEAVSKALGTGFSGFWPSDIEVLRNPAGKPYVRLLGEAARTAEEQNISRIHVSLTDEGCYVMAFAIAEGDRE